MNDTEQYANPFIECKACHSRVTWRRGNANMPCGHHADWTNLCPSWGPVDGCSCKEQLGFVGHPDVLPLWRQA